MSNETSTAQEIFSKIPNISGSLEKIRAIFQLITRPGISRRVTAMEDWDTFFVKMVLDSVMAPGLPELLGEKVLDLGSGGGFPGLLLALVRPKASVTLLDSVARKGQVALEAAQSAGIGNIDILTGRAEDLAREKAHRASYDSVTAKAVAPLPVLLELSIPFLKLGGRVLAYKGPGAEKEIEEASRAMKLLGCRLEQSIDYSLPCLETGEGPFERRILVILKEKPTLPAYPRKAGTPKKSPL